MALPSLTPSARKNLNIFLLGLAFSFIFAAFLTIANIQAVILENARDESSSGYQPDFDGDGFVALCVIYGVSSVVMWVAPSVMAVIGVKFTLITGGVWYATYVASFLHLDEVLLYATSAMIGAGTALMWTAQGTFLTINSEEDTLGRNSGIFWTMMQSAAFAGNTFAYFKFRNQDDISSGERTSFVSVLVSICSAGVLTFSLVLPTPWAKEFLSDSKPDTPKGALIKSVKLLATPEMLQLVSFFFFMGMELTFFSGVYGPCLGFTQKFDDPKSLAALNGVLVSIGEILGGLVLGCCGRAIFGTCRSPAVVVGTSLQFAAYAGILINIPNDAPVPNSEGDFDTLSEPLVGSPKAWVAMICSLLLGAGDACFNTQAMALVGGIFPDKLGPAFAIFKCIQGIGASVGFAYAGVLPLYWQLGLLFSVGTAGTCLFTKIDMESRRKESKWAKKEEGTDPDETKREAKSSASSNHMITVA